MTKTPESNLSAHLDAKIDVAPKASQVVLVMSMGVSALALICGTILLTGTNANSNAGWAMLILSGLMFSGTLFAWRKAQSDTDMAGSHPTTLKRSDGTSVSTDSRTIRDVNAMQGVMQFFQMRPLPQADGIIDENGNVIPNSKEAAGKIVDEINDDVQATVTQLANTMMQTGNISSNPPEVVNQIAEDYIKISQEKQENQQKKEDEEKQRT